MNIEDNIDNNNKNLHDKYNQVINCFPDDIENLNNFILYGPSGSGKYHQILKILKKYSASNLKYEKKILFPFNKQNYYYKISDIHIEIDMALLGCNSRILWNDLYYFILDIIEAKPDKKLIILCKNFNDIHSELLDVFYSYMQNINNIKNSSIILKYIILTSDISFINDNILNLCDIISLPKPTKSNLTKCFGKIPSSTDINKIENLKYISTNIIPHEKICNNIIDYIINIDDVKFIKLRELLYEMFTYNLNIYNCIYYITINLSLKYPEMHNDENDIFIRLYDFFKLYNNNYRPIYHLEKYIINIIKIIHKL